MLCLMCDHKIVLEIFNYGFLIFFYTFLKHFKGEINHFTVSFYG